jgi:hypothetical protein
MPFQYRPYQNRHVGTIADLMGRGRDAEAQALITAANAQAQAAQISGQAWGGAVQSIGNTIAAIPGQMQAQQDQELALEDRALEREERLGNIDYRAARTSDLEGQNILRVTNEARQAEQDIRLKSLLENPGGFDPKDVLALLGTERGSDLLSALASLQSEPGTPDERAEELKKILQGLASLSPEMRIEAWPATRARALANTALGLNPEDVPEVFDEAWFTQMRNYAVDPTGSAQVGAGTDYRAYLERVAQGLEIPVAELTPEQELDARRQFTTAGSSQAPQLGRDADRQTARVIADAVCRGEQPPTLTGLRKYTGLVREEMAKLGCDLTESTQDWNAISKHISTLNSAGQLRMRQATTFAYHSLDLVEKFANEWDAGQFPALNKAEMQLAMAGGLGKEAARIANNLNSTITDLVSELATVYRGGLSSTDSSIALAAENLKTEWSKEVLLSGIQLMRDTLQIRLNSINTTGVAGTPYNRYSRDSVPVDDAGAAYEAPGAAGGLTVGADGGQDHWDSETGKMIRIYWHAGVGGEEGSWLDYPSGMPFPQDED